MSQARLSTIGLRAAAAPGFSRSLFRQTRKKVFHSQIIVQTKKNTT